MPIRHFIRKLPAAVLAFGATGAAAFDAPRLDFSGYGTIGVVRSGEDRGDYIVDVFRPDGPGFSREWSPEVDSRLGLQLAATFGPRFSAVVQVISQQRHDDTFTPMVEWANVKYQVTPELSLRAGRIVLPTFLVTDTRRVGYANPWVRPPVEIYSMVPVTNSDGVDASWQASFGALANTLQVTLGRTSPHLPDAGAGKAEARKLLVVVDTLEHGAATARLTYGQASLTVASIDRQFDAFRQFGAQGRAVASRNTVRDRDVWFFGLGASYDPGGWFVTGEWAKFDTRSILGAKRSWYLSGGYRFGSLTPYATVARTQDTNVRSDPGLDLALLPPPVRPAAAALNTQLNRALANPSGQRTVSAGVRWDFARSAALKLQYDHVSLASGSTGSFDPRAPGFPTGGDIGVFSAAVDFVF